MSDHRHGYVKYQSREYQVTWHPISNKDLYHVSIISPGAAIQGPRVGNSPGS